MADEEKKKLEEEKRRKQAEIERKRAEVRARMEEASKAKKAKKGFMTPERKKKLRLLLRKKAAEELKKEQERKAAERRRIIEERCGKPKLVDESNEGQLKKICKDYYDRMYICEEQKWDLEREVRKRDWEIADLNSQVNDLRGKFMKPTLKKVSKYENKFAKLQKKAAEFNFRNQLKVVKKKEFTLEEEDKEKKPDWSKKGDEKKEEEEAEASETTAGAEVTPAGEAVPVDEGHPVTEGEAPADDKLTEGQPAEGAPTEGQASAEGTTPAEVVPTEGATGEGAPPTEGSPAEEAPAGGFETFKQLVINENYDIIALPETVLAPTDNKEAVSIPHYSLVENRKNSGDGVVLYIKDSLKYKVVDLTTENPEAHVSFDDLLEKIKKNGGAPPSEGTAAPVEGVPVEGTATTEEGAPASTEEASAVAEDTAVSTESAPAAEETPVSTENAAAPAEPAAATEPAASESTAAAETASIVVDAPASGDGPAIEPLSDAPPAISSPPIIEAAA